MKTINKKEIKKLADDLLKNPELGYKEFKTKQIITDYLKKHDFKVENECFRTGFSVSIGNGHPHIGLIAELDAIPTLGHKYANINDNNAAHACGHSTQCVIMAGAMSLLKDESFKGKVTLFFTPAEEYTDIKFREQLIKKKEIKYIGGKINMLDKGLFDDCDVVLHLHAMGENKYKYSIGSNLSGFVYKKIKFIGKAAHGAVAPHLGINALNEYALFNGAINMLRETFKEEDAVRIHGFISEGGQTVNSIPERVTYECYVRAMNQKALNNVANKVDEAAKHCAKAIGGSCRIETRPGYLPLIQNTEINNIVYKEMLKLVKENEIEVNVPSMAAGDIGDISIFKPTIQFGYGGFTGIPHGKTFMVKDEELVYFDTIKLVYNTVISLLNKPELINKIIKEYKPLMSKKEYKKFIDGK